MNLFEIGNLMGDLVDTQMLILLHLSKIKTMQNSENHERRIRALLHLSEIETM